MIRDGITYDDVLLVPQHSTVESRSNVDTSVKIGNLLFANPIIGANMKDITGYEMAEAIISSKGLAIIHRFMDNKEQLNIAKKIVDYHGPNHFAVSIGVKPADKEMVDNFYNVGVRIMCIDIAHGDSSQCIDMINWVKNKHNDIFLIAGNVATGDGAKRLWNAGADVVKVGIGPGSLCSTRIETGNGVPQLTAIMNVSEAQKQMRELHRTKSTNSNNMFPFIADGGIKSAGDIVKSLCFADMVMVGNLFAGCNEAPGKIFQSIDGTVYKEYAGSSTHKKNYVEGVSAMVPCKGPFKQILGKLLEGLRSGMSYQNAHNLEELRDNPQFIKISNSGLVESHPHDIKLK